MTYENNPKHGKPNTPTKPGATTGQRPDLGKTYGQNKPTAGAGQGQRTHTGGGNTQNIKDKDRTDKGGKQW